MGPAWDAAAITLDAPDGRRVLEAPSAFVHRFLDLYALYAEGKVQLGTAEGLLAFEKQPAAVAALRRLAEAGLAVDPEFRAALRRASLRAVLIGLGMFAVGGGLFGLYCWYASWAPDPPPGHWIRWLTGAVRGVLFVLVAVGLVGPFWAYYGLMQWQRVRRIERQAAGSGGAADRQVQ